MDPALIRVQTIQFSALLRTRTVIDCFTTPHLSDSTHPFELEAAASDAQTAEHDLPHCPIDLFQVAKNFPA